MHKIQCKKDNYSQLLEWKLYIVHNVKKRFLDREMDGNGDNNTEKQRSANVPLSVLTVATVPFRCEHNGCMPLSLDL